MKYTKNKLCIKFVSFTRLQHYDSLKYGEQFTKQHNITSLKKT